MKESELIEKIRHLGAELARRDKEAGEPVGYIRESEANLLNRLKQHQVVEVAVFRERAFSNDMPMFTAAQPAPIVPDGWKLVPVEPNWAMLSAAIKFHEGEAFLPASLYKAMLAAAPSPGGENESD